MFNRLMCIAVFASLLLSACGGTTAPITQTPKSVKGSLPSLTGNWTISMTHSGGIMGLMRSVEINSMGSYTVKDERGDRNMAGQLSEEDLTNLIQVINSTIYSQNNKPSGCADCFIYDVVISSDNGKFSAQVDDISIDESGLSTLVTTLRALIERELK